MITSPTPGTFVIALHFKGRDKPIVEMDLKIDDLLEKASKELRYSDCRANDYRYQQKESNTMLDLEYVQLHVNKILALLNKVSVSPRTVMLANTLVAAFRQTTIDISVRATASSDSSTIYTIRSRYPPHLRESIVFTTRLAIHIVVCTNPVPTLLLDATNVTMLIESRNLTSFSMLRD
jgi:hypothetical protein